VPIRCVRLSLSDKRPDEEARSHERDKYIIKAHLARRTLIEAFSEETVGEE
jgi:hypothetical protein